MAPDICFKENPSCSRGFVSNLLSIISILDWTTKFSCSRKFWLLEGFTNLPKLGQSAGPLLPYIWVIQMSAIPRVLGLKLLNSAVLLAMAVHLFDW